MKEHCCHSKLPFLPFYYYNHFPLSSSPLHREEGGLYTFQKMSCLFSLVELVWIFRQARITFYWKCYLMRKIFYDTKSDEIDDTHALAKLTSYVPGLMHAPQCHNIWVLYLLGILSITRVAECGAKCIFL